MTEVIITRDEQHWLELRTKDLTSTDIAALFGLSPYKTAFELFHEKRDGQVVKLKPNERMKWGKPRAQIPSRFLMEMRGETERAKKAADSWCK